MRCWRAPAKAPALPREKAPSGWGEDPSLGKEKETRPCCPGGPGGVEGIWARSKLP